MSPYPALERIARRRPRTGIGAIDLTQLPGAQTAWGSIQTQMQNEGLGADAIGFAYAQFGDALNGAAASWADGQDPQTAISAAATLVQAGHTISGTVQHVQGILAAAQGGDPTQVYNMFTGSMLSLVAAAGISMPGIGSAIVFGVGIALDFMKQAGLFGGGAPVGYSLPGCSSSITTSDQATLQVGCIGMHGAGSAQDGGALPKGSVAWRHFPKGSGGNPNDALWYLSPKQILAGQYDPKQVNLSFGGFGARGAQTVQSFEWSGSSAPASVAVPYLWEAGGSGYRFIDIAFPDYHYLSCQTTYPGLGDFQTAFSQAWIANKEYELNGIKSQPDTVVLDNLVRVWNRAHDSTTYVDVPPATKGTIPDFSVSMTSDGGWPCPSGLPPLFQTVIGELIGRSSPQTATYIQGNSAIRINTGPLITVPKKHLDLHLGTFSPPPTTVAGQLAAQFVTLPLPAQIALVAGGAAGATAAGGSLYAVATGQSVGAFWKGVWQATQKTGTDAVSSALGVFDQVGTIFAAGKRRK